MFNRSVFSKRFKLVRTTYKFTIIEFASTFEIVTKTTVGAWEKETIIPSADVLADLSSFFGISLDWFSGFSDVPYTEASIENAEKYAMNKIFEIDKRKVYIHRIPEDYLNTEQRKKVYSLPVRANIIVLLHCSYIPFIKKFNKEMDKKEGNTNFISDFLDRQLDRICPELRPSKKVLYDYHLYALLFKESSTPFYNIESSSET